MESYVGSAKFAGAGAVSSFAFGRVSVGAATRTNFESASDEEDGSPTANFPAGPRVGLGAPGRRERTPPWGETSGWEAARVSQHESGDDAGRGDGTRGRGFSGPGHPGRPIGAIEFVTENASCGKTNNGGGGRARRKRARVRAEHGSRETSSSYGFGGGFRRGGAYHLVSRASRPVRPCARLTESEVTTFSPSRFFFSDFVYGSTTFFSNYSPVTSSQAKPTCALSAFTASARPG